MNIIIPHSWLREFLDTKASPQKIAECLSLCSCSVEKLEKIGIDFLYHIEITTNRVDMMSVSGMAREAAAVLAQFGIKAKFKNDPYDKNQKFRPEAGQSWAGKIIIKDPSLCPRFAAAILKNVTIKPSPKIVQERLEKTGIRPLNNIIDLSNWLMRAYGQPVHVFDYDKILGKTMILRESKKGEKITTLDEKTFTLPGNDIVIEDGQGRLIDLCGIMGGLNSAVGDKTKNILLFVQTYDPTHIRQTSMKLAQRTEAAQLFEKGIDPQLVMPTLLEGIKLAKNWAGAKQEYKIIDIYKNPYKPKTIRVSLDFINQRLGIELKTERITKILKNLGFNTKLDPDVTSGRNLKFKITVPSWRANDINIPEDIVEEVARVYGYHNLPSNLPCGQLPQSSPFAKTFYWEKKVKNLLAGFGLTEVYTYSMVSRGENLLKIKNPLSSDWIYMRDSLLASHLAVIAKNKSLIQDIKIFEIANVYLPRKNNLPLEIPHLAITLVGKKFFQLKGIIETILAELSIEFSLKPSSGEESLEIFSGSGFLGKFGQVNREIYFADIDFDQLVKLASNIKIYRALAKYPPIIEDLTFVVPLRFFYSDITALVKKISKLIVKIDLVGRYEDKLTFRIHYQNPEKSLTDLEVGNIRKLIVQNLESKGLRLVGKI